MSKRTALLCTVTALAALCMTSAVAAHDDDRADHALVAARQKVFGTENVDARSGRVRDDKVIISWITNASFAASVMGRAILLDTYVTRLEVAPGRTPSLLQDPADPLPEPLSTAPR